MDDATTGSQMRNVPKGIEVLIKKASVDPAFRAKLLARRAAAADEIGLRLEPAEVVMINAVPAEHLAAAIDSAKVPPSQLPAFLGWSGLAMLAALVIAGGMCLPTLGHTSDRPHGVGKPADQPANDPAEEKPGEQPQPPVAEDEQGK